MTSTGNAEGANKPDTREAVARAIQQADAAFAYKLTLTRLVDGVSTYDLTIVDGPTVQITGDDAYEQAHAVIKNERAQLRADAILALPALTAEGEK